MKSMPSRDTTGRCEGECRNRVFEGEMERQSEINSMRIDYDTPTPSLSWASRRDAPPGFLGGHI